MQWYHYPLLVLSGFVIVVLTITLIGFIFFKFFVLLFIIGAIVIIATSVTYLWTLFLEKKKEKDEFSYLDEIADELTSLSDKLHSSEHYGKES